MAALTAATWRKWGMPEIDAGAEMTTADLVKHGALAYRDVRYYYGPIGLYSLALAFKLAGTSFTTAYAFGLAQTAAILATFYALARQWLNPLVAGLASAVLMAIGYSGTAFNFILPHTNSATFGLLGVLAMLLALARGRMLWAGMAAGIVGLTRPEFVAVAWAGMAAYTAVTWRMDGRVAAWRAAWRLALPALALPALVLGWFATRAGAGTLFTENLWPVKFIRVGAKTEQNWMPFTLSSLLGLAARASIYLGLLAALVKSVEGWREGRDARRRVRAQERGGGPAEPARGPLSGPITALWPLGALALTLALADAALRASGVLSEQRAAIEGEVRHLTLGMSWLPALGLGVCVVAAVRLMRGGESPLRGGEGPVRGGEGPLRGGEGPLRGGEGPVRGGEGPLRGGEGPVRGADLHVSAEANSNGKPAQPVGARIRSSWPVDAALIVVAAGLGLRAYNAFTTEGSYAPYYTAPLLLLLGILHTRVAERHPRARAASLGALGLVAAGLAAYALGGLYVHDTTAVHTPRGTFITTAAAAPALEGAVRAIDAATRPGERILAAPDDGGLYFMADRPPALYELTLLPGLLATPAEERRAVTRLRGEHVRLAVSGARDLAAWGTPTFGVDYDRLLGAYLRGATSSGGVIGTLAQPVGGTSPSKGFTIERLR